MFTQLNSIRTTFNPLPTRRILSKMTELIQHVATSPTIFRFLGLPVEIRCGVVNHLSRPSEIKDALSCIERNMRHCDPAPLQ